MKILLLANHFNAGGITTCLLTLGKGYVGRGHEVFIASSGGGCVAQAEGLGIRHLAVPALAVKCEAHPVLLSAVRRVSRLVRGQGVDILHAHTRVTQVVSAACAGMTGRPYVSTCHGFFKPRLSRLLFPLWGRRAIAISRPVAGHLVRDLHVPEARVAFVPNGIDAARFKPASPVERQARRESFGLDAAAPVIGMLARLSDVKGHVYLIEAMDTLRRSVPGVICLLVGEGPMEERLKAMVAARGLEQTVLFWRITGRPQEILPVFDVFAMPSLQEGLGLSAMEAAACGIPVVASRAGGLVEAVLDGTTGFLVPVKDAAALAAALGKLLADKGLAQRFGHAGRARIMADFSADVMVDKTLDVYRKAAVARA